MPTTQQNYWQNRLKLRQNGSLLHPLVIVYYLTTNCNLNCTYCEDFGARLNLPGNAAEWEQITHTLKVARTGVDSILFTGGEPLTHPRLLETLKYARHDQKFRHISLLSNGYLLDQQSDILPLVDRLIISLDSPSPARWHKMIGVPLSAAEKIIRNIKQAAQHQSEHRFKLVLNCVITPETIEDARQSLMFAQDIGVYVSFSPQAVNNWPHYDLLVSTDYRNFIAELIGLKRRGAPILGSLTYLENLQDFREYQCYPTLAPRIMPKGDLIYPCRPVEKESDSFGGRLNLAQVNSWEEAINMLAKDYGDPPISCTSCFQQCYIEPSLMQSRPLDYLKEFLFYPPSRRANLATHTPG